LQTAKNPTAQEQEMKALAVVVLALATLASASAFAQSKTRAQVYQELIQAQQDGRDFVTDTSYPEVNPIFAHQLEQQQARLAQQQTANVVASATPATNPSAAN
jgi:hypothetical protein